MIHIDGSQGEGGGQILRSSLALSAMTGQAFRIENIRAGREKPGLMRQHLTAVNAAATICSATVQGAAIGSRELAFYPKRVTAGEYTFSIGSAGSTTLVLQAVLPPLMLAEGRSALMRRRWTFWSRRFCRSSGGWGRRLRSRYSGRDFIRRAGDGFWPGLSR
jgi:RNA 3'-terminal phosphate cyclase (ATP)